MQAEIKSPKTILEEYNLRWYQTDFEQAMFSGYRRAYLLYHRRAGKDFSCWMFTIYCALVDEPGIYYYILPTYTQGKKVIWDSIDESGKRLLDYIPRDVVDGKPNSSEMKIRLTNGSLIQIIGSDNPDAIRGTNPKGVVFSEYAMQDPRIWSEIISPILVRNKGWAVFNTTPQGRNHAYDLWENVKDSDHWFMQKLTIDDTNLISKEDIQREIEEGKSEEIIQQEYYVSWSRGIDGTYYGKLIETMHKEGRIGNVAYEPRSMVHTAWDIGFGDSTSIIFWQQVASEIRIIDYYEDNAKQIADYIKILQNKPYVYGTHYMPHDAGSGSIQTGQTLQKYALGLGLKTTILDRDDIDLGIQQVRSLLSICWMDKTKCARLIKCLENYCKKYNDKMQCYSETPLHNWASHASDAFRYLAAAHHKYGSGGYNDSKIKDLNRKYYGYTY